MRQFSSAIGIIVLFVSATRPHSSPHREVYSWVSFEIVKKDAAGRLLEPLKWTPSVRMPGPDTFEFSAACDTIRMHIPGGDSAGDLFGRTEIRSAKWKPRPSYGDALFFLGTYTKQNMPG